MKRSLTSHPRSASEWARLRFTNEGLLWLGAAAIIGFLGWWKSINVVFLLANFMLSLLAVNILIARLNLWRVQVVREPHPPIHAGEEVAVRLTATNVGRRPATVFIRDEVEGQTAASLVPDLPGGARVACHLRRTIRTRGVKPARLRVSTGYPLGLVTLTRAASSSEIVVLPARGTIEPNGLRRWLLRTAGDNDRSRKALRSLTADPADVRGLRPYRPGDPIRTVHWKSSARRGELMVREYDAARAMDLVLVIEPWLPPNPSSHERAALEAALSLAASIAVNWSRVYETPLIIALAGDPGSVRATASSDHGVREALAPLARVAGDSSFEPLPRDAFDRPLARVARILVSSRPRSPYATMLAKTTGRPFIAISPADRLPWYHPPEEDVHPVNDRVGSTDEPNA